MLDERQIAKADDITAELNSITLEPAQWRWEELEMRTIGFFLRYDGHNYGIRFSVERMMDPALNAFESVVLATWERVVEVLPADDLPVGAGGE